jgi:hypothetical protein
MEKLEKIVNRYQEENRPLIIKTKTVEYPVAEEVIPEEDSSFDEEEDLESGNPRIKRIKRCLKGPCNFYNWKCLQDEPPYNTLFNSVIFISSLVWGVIGGIKLYHMYY